MRGQGHVYRPMVGDRETKVWWLDYSIRGERFRESSKTRSKTEALELLRTKIGDRKTGKLTGRPEKVTLTDLRDMLKAHYVIEGNTSWPRAEQAFRHLIEHFGEDAKAMEIDDDAVAEYQAKRLTVDEAARNSVKYETGCLIAAFGVAAKRLGHKRTFKNLPDDKNAIRKGFFTESEFATVVASLPTEIADLIRFLYMTGWRRGEAESLVWPQIDWDDAEYPGAHDEPVPGSNACVLIATSDTKGEDQRVYPFAGATELRELLLSRWRVRDGLNVFHQRGQPIKPFPRIWKRACKAAGCEDRLVHDLRRSAARDARRSGLSEGDIMKLSGWKTRAMFDRYNIIDSADLQRAVVRRFGGNAKPASNIPAEDVAAD